jgi:hypothetical protein
MHRRSLLVLVALLIAVPMSASQFVNISFDQVTRESDLIVRGTLGPTWSAWDDEHQIIYTYSTVRVTRYLGAFTGPDTLVVREVGGTVDDYTQQAVGFPVLREGEDVVLFLAKWDESSTDYRIHAYNQGKYLVQIRARQEVVVEDPVKQGDAPIGAGDRMRVKIEAAGADTPAITLDELAGMIDAAIAGQSIGDAIKRQ